MYGHQKISVMNLTRVNFECSFFVRWNSKNCILFEKLLMRFVSCKKRVFVVHNKNRTIFFSKRQKFLKFNFLKFNHAPLKSTIQFNCVYEIWFSIDCQYEPFFLKFYRNSINYEYFICICKRNAWPNILCVTYCMYAQYMIHWVQ